MPDSDSDIIIFSLPPSANACWRNFRGRTILSKKYREWRSKNMHYQSSGNKIEPKLYPVWIWIIIHPGKNWRKSDLDNRIKPILDQLQHCNYISGDDTDCVKAIAITIADRLPAGQESFVSITLEKFKRER